MLTTRTFSFFEAVPRLVVAICARHSMLGSGIAVTLAPVSMRNEHFAVAFSEVTSGHTASSQLEI